MNLGGDAADQVVRYSLEGMNYSLRLSGTLAKNMAIFFIAVLKDQKKTRGKTRLVRMLKENRPVKFFTIPKERMKEFAVTARKRGLLYVVIRDKKNPDKCEVMTFAEDAAKVNRIMDKMGLDFLKAESGQAVMEVTNGKEEIPDSVTQTVEMPEGEVQFEIDESEMDFSFDEPQMDAENFFQVQEGEEKNPSEPSLHSNDIFTKDDKTEPESSEALTETQNVFIDTENKETEKKPSVREELEKIKQEKQEAAKKQAVNRKRSSKRSANRKKKKSKSKGR